LDGFGNQALRNGVSDDFLAKVIRYALNHHPRKTLNWLTPTQGLSGIFNVLLWV
jgi:IS30 family transposase